MHKKQGYTLGNRKLAIIGAGYVGSSIAYALALRNVTRKIVMIDINHEKTDGDAKDIRHGVLVLEQLIFMPEIIVTAKIVT